MSDIYSIPEWVWDLVIALQKYREEHPKLYRYGGGVPEYVPTECFDHAASGIVPRDVWFAAEAIAHDRARRADS